LVSHLIYHTRHLFTPAATLICLQEVLHTQLCDLALRHFNARHDWACVGVGRDDGKTAGEYAPIFFRPSAWTLLHFETLWLNETGQVGRRGWDAASVRILTCAVLESSAGRRDQPGGARPKKVLALNTHLDDQGKVSRRESAKLIVRAARELRQKWDVDFWFLAGDLNSEPSGDAYRIINEAGSGFIDARKGIDDVEDSDGAPLYGNEMTFTGFDGKGDDGEGKSRIDFVHVGVDDGAGTAQGTPAKQVTRGYAVLPNRFDEGIYMSDHRAVVADLVW